MPRRDGINFPSLEYKSCPRLRVGGVKKRVSHIVMEKYLKRKLLPKEIVHHMDGDTNNNDISNLKVMTNSDHGKHHNPRDSSRFGVSAADNKKLWNKIYRREINNKKGIPPRVFKINQKIFNEIKQLLFEKILNQQQIAEKFKIHQSVVSRINSDTRYQHFTI